MDHETILVDQTALRKLGRNAQTAYANVFSRLLLQREHFFRKVGTHDPRILSFNLLQCRGEYDLIERVEHASELIGCFILRLVFGDFGPIGYHELICFPAEQEEIRIAQQPGEVLVHRVVGTLIGVATGIVTALNIDVIVPAIESAFNIKFLSKDVYLIPDLPSDLQVADVVSVAFLGLGLSLFATLYPSWSASRVNPAEALRYE